MPPEEAKNRILDAALDCFAEKGYRATTITNIETAAGLSPGSGATYRHFRSKREILEEGIRVLRARTDAFLAPVNTSMEGSAYDGIELGRRNAVLFRILFRDLDQFPDLHRKVLDDLIDGPYRVAAERTAVIAPNGDAEAIAVVVSNAMVGFTLFESVWGIHPLGVDPDRFAKAWARLLELVIADELGPCDDDEAAVDIDADTEAPPDDDRPERNSEP